MRRYWLAVLLCLCIGPAWAREEALQLARLDARAHEVGDGVVLQEVHSLMPPDAVVGTCTAGTRAAFAQRAGLQGATLAWMAPRADRASGAVKAVNAQAAR